MLIEGLPLLLIEAMLGQKIKGWELTSTWKCNNIDIFWNLKFSHFRSIQIDFFELKNWFLIGWIFIPFNQNNELNIKDYVIDIT